MLRVTVPLLERGQYKERVKTRMVGYIPKVVPRKVKGALIKLHSDANTGYSEGYIKTTDERMENTGKRLAKVIMDPLVGRPVVAREAKIKSAGSLKSHIQRKLTTPF